MASRWKPSDKVAFVFAVLFGIMVGTFAGLGHFHPDTGNYWLHVASWSVMGAGLGAAGGGLHQLLRTRSSK